jgi:ribose 5-phosphate isomerase B
MSASEPILIASDHAAFDLKKKLIETLTDYRFEDLGPSSNQSVDYPDFAEKVASKVSRGEAKRGILICGSGIGMSITANKFSGVRAALVESVESAMLSRQHNDANILCMGSRILPDHLALEIAKAWLSTPFSNEPRHCGRIEKIKKLEKLNGAK